MLTSTTTTALTLDEHMRARYEARNLEYKTYVIQHFPPIQTIESRVSYGLLSWTLLDIRERWIKPKAAIYTQYGLQTASEICRDYLDFVYPNRLRATGRQAEAITLHRSAPLYARPGYHAECVYVDIRAAFWSIMLLSGWDVDYFPNRWIRRGRPPIDFPLSSHKVARNCLVSAALPSPMKMWTGTKFIKQYRRNVHINFSLWALIMDTLHSVAMEAIKHGAVYIHTDGAILPVARVQSYIEAVAAYGLDAQIKHNSYGECWIFGMGNWRCGERTTKRFGASDRVMSVVDTVYYPYNELIKRKLYKFSTVVNKRWTRLIQGATLG